MSAMIKWTKQHQCSGSLLLVVAVALGLSCGCRRETAENGQPGLEMTGEAARVLSQLEKMPVWAFLAPEPYSSAEIQEIEDTVCVVSKSDLDTLRRAVVGYVADDRVGLKAMNVFVLNRYLFEFPDAPAAQRAQVDPFWGGWVRVDGGDVDLRWPWTVSSDGRWHLATPGRYSGPGYDAVEAFDYYRTALGKRKAAGENCAN